MGRQNHTIIGFIFVFLGFLSMSFFHGCGIRNNISDDKIIATVNDQYIVLDDFVKRLELTPLQGANRTNRNHRKH